MTDFDKWLNKTLQELNTDESVFGPYIDGILTGEESAEEQREALTDLLTGVTEESALEKLVEEILQKWSTTNETASGNETKKQDDLEDVETKLAKLLEANIRTNAAQRTKTEEEKQLRSRILEDYGQLSDPEADDEGAEGGFVAENDPDLVKNTNVSDVQALKKERREQSRLESAEKKQKDKEDREKQKKQREEKKEKRKTVKQERRR